MEYRELKSPFSVQIEVTEECNNNCIHCYNHWRDSGSKKQLELSEEEIMFISDAVIDNEIFAVTLTGGEPLLVWQRLLPFIHKMTVAGVEVSLNSNLSLMTPLIARYLKEAGLKTLLVSLLSCDSFIHNNIANRNVAWQETIEGIKIAADNGFAVNVNMVLLRQNYDTLYETGVFASKLGCRSFSATKASPALNNRKFDNLRLDRNQIKKSLETLQRICQDTKMPVDILECYPLCLVGEIERHTYFARHSCRAGVTTCTIGSTGEIRPCSHADMCYGNLFKEDFKIVWSRMSDWKKCVYLPKECTGCRFVGLCSGGCRMEAKYLGDICGKDPYMTNPEDVVKTKTVSQKNISLENISDDCKYRLSSGCRLRKESFGGVLKTFKSGMVLLNESGFDIVELMFRSEIFSINDLQRNLSNGHSGLKNFVLSLINRGSLV